MIKKILSLIFKILKWIFYIILFIGMIILFLVIFQGTIYIEILIIFLLMMSFIFWKIWTSITKKKLLKNYKTEDDKSKKPKEVNEFIRRTSDERTERTEQEFADANTSSFRPKQSEGRKLLSATKADNNRKNSPGRRKTSQSPRGFFARRKRR